MSAVIEDLDAVRVAAMAASLAMPTPLPSALAPVPPFPLDALPDSFRPWVADVTERMQCPADFVAVPLVVAASSLSARSVALRLKRRDDWTECANLWAMIVGRPGVMKSPAMRAALAPLERLEAAAVDAHGDALQRWETETKAHELRAKASAGEALKRLKRDRSADVADLLAGEVEAAAPIRARFIVNSPSWEKLHALLAENAGGLLMSRDELRGWFLHLAREDNAEARSFFVQAWSGGSFTVDRIGRGTITASDLRVSIIGAIQPGPLGEVMRASGGGGDDGLMDRFLVAWPDDPGPWRDVDRFADSTARDRVSGVFDRLAALRADDVHAEQDRFPDGSPDGMPFLRLDEAAGEVFGQWRADLENRLRAPQSETGEAALAKFRHHVPALALTLHLADGGVGPVGELAMLRALALADYFEAHSRRLYGSGRRAAVQGAQAIVAKVLSGDLAEPFSARDVHQRNWSGLTERDAVADALGLLDQHGWVFGATLETGGRPTTVYTLTEGARA